MAEPPSALTYEERQVVSAALDEQASYLQMGIRAWENRAMPPDAPISKADLEQQLAVVESARVKVLAHAAAVRAAFRAGQERMRDESASIALVPLMNAATTYDPAKGERPICYDCTRGVAKALELYRAAIRALPLEEPE